MSKAVKFSIIGVILLVVGYLFASPYIAIHQIKEAVQKGDSEKLANYIDFPSVRQSFKDQLNAQMVKEMANQKNNNDEFAALGAMLASVMVEKMVDAIVTPQGITLMLQGKDLKQSGLIQGTPAPQQEVSSTNENIDYSLSYQSFNRVNMILENKDRPEKGKATVKMERDGLSWKIKAFEVPMDKIKAAYAAFFNPPYK
ncbi:DUF2939 domain-containing protein [Acinetobacter sp. UGAL515B_02]|nr:DUF2939 domain-containing protein [Acinetobacter sp. UGAL515B_02]WON80810.1 DUF2939 domain-containing protein [Acinetobacter sp. UGAL515B_02]